MKKSTITYNFILILLLIINPVINSQDKKLFTRNGEIQFYSKAPMEDIKAINHSVMSTLDQLNGNLEFAVLMKGFEFEKGLMQTHFNENYVESDIYPSAQFVGKIEDHSSLDWETVYNSKVIVSGLLTIHGVTNKVKTEGTITRVGEKFSGKASFYIEVSDYDIKIPRIVMGKIAKNIRIDVDVTWDQTVVVN